MNGPRAFCSSLASIAICWLVALSPISVAADPAEPPVTAADLPRIPATPLDQVAKTFQVKAGFEFQLVAGEPMVVDPVAFDFDESGRLFVVEMRDYSERRQERLGRIRVLEDLDHDGVFDRSTVFAEGLPWPTALLCYQGGLFVGSTPDLLYLKDLNGDGQADERRVVFTGFAEASLQRLNVQALMNSFHWGLDQRIHGSASVSGGTIRRPDDPTFKPVELRGRDFSFDPRTLELRPETGGGQHGMSFDNYGRKYLCSNSDHIQAVLYDDRYAGVNPWAELPSARESIAVDGPAAEVFRLSPDEPWRVIRTRWRVTGAVQGLVEGGGRPSGYFTGATGTTIYRGDAFPPEYVGDAFVADCGSNLIHHKRVRPVGLSFRAERPPEERQSEFIASRDNWFRPVQFMNAPDGTLYVADMYREVIEHPWSLPDSIKKLLDLNSGNDRGRIYRITPRGFKPSALPDFSKRTSLELVALLAHPNGWHRETASRLLFERNDPSVTEALLRLAKESSSELGRIHALWVLKGNAGLTAPAVEFGLKDSSSRVREQAVRLLEELPAGSIPDSLLALLPQLAADPDLRVAAQVAWSTGRLAPPNRLSILEVLSDASVRHPELIPPTIHASAGLAAPLFHRSLARSTGVASETTLLTALARSLALRGNKSELKPVLEEVVQGKPSVVSLAVLTAFAEGLERSGKEASSAIEVPGFSSHLSFARSALGGGSPPETTPSLSSTAARFFGCLPEAVAAEPLLGLLVSSTPTSTLEAVATAFGKMSTASSASALIDRWSSVPAAVRSELLGHMIRKKAWRPVLVAGLESGRVGRNELTIEQLQRLRSESDPELRDRITRLVGTPHVGERQEVINRFLPALSKVGSALEGSKIYETRCATCHRSGGKGRAIGPDFESVRSMGKEKLLTQILDPNREVAPSYLAYRAETASGDTVQGLLVSETADRVRLRSVDGTEMTLERASLKGFAPTGLSLMPEGLEEGLTEQQMADLLAFVITP